MIKLVQVCVCGFGDLYKLLLCLVECIHFFTSKFPKIRTKSNNQKGGGQYIYILFKKGTTLWVMPRSWI